MDTIVIKQLQLISKHWLAYIPKTKEQKDHKTMMVKTLRESIAELKRELKAHDYFEMEELAEIES